MSKWIRHSLGEGVVLTRQATALRDGELQSASFCRLAPGDRDQLYPDTAYSTTALSYRSDETVIYIRTMSFEAGARWMVHVLQGDTYGAYALYDLDNPQTSGSGQLIPSVLNYLTFRPTEAQLVNDGAQYFLGVSGVDTTIGDTDPARKTGIQVVFYIDDTGTFARRDAGAQPSGLVVGAEQQLPQLASTLFQLPNQETYGGWITEIYNWETLLTRDLYGSNANYLAFYPTPAERDEVRELFLGSGPPVFSGREMTLYVPIKSLRLSVPGNGYVFAYWATEYDSGFDIESAPSDITNITNADAAVATWEIVLDWQKFANQIGGERTNSSLYGSAARFVDYYSAEGPGGVNGQLRDQRVAALFALKDMLSSGAFQRDRAIVVELSEDQRADMQNVVSVSGQMANPNFDKVRLYRQNLGFFSDFNVEYTASGAGTPSNPEQQGEGLRNAQDIKDGRIERQGGLLKEYDTSDLPINHEDYLRESGVSDPALAYPTVNWSDRGGLGVYAYLRRPSNWGVGATMGEIILRVPWDADIDANSVMVSPARAPEQQPLVWRIPVVTERQDAVRALQTLRDRLILLTRNSSFTLNYIPFEGTSQSDRVLTQISANHGASSHTRALTLETERGQLVVFLSDVGLMGTNGLGLFDICPDFSLAAARRAGFTFGTVCLVNNPNEYRLELWADGIRWDFLYHQSQLKDIRGDGSGLVFKMLGPHRWYPTGDLVTAACSGDVGGEIIVYHTHKSASGGHHLVSSTSNISEKTASVTTRKWWGSNPKSRLRTKFVGLQHNYDVVAAKITVAKTPVDEVGGTTDAKTLRLDLADGFSERMLSDGLGTSGVYTVQWAGGAVGPLWTQEEEAPSGTGR